FTQRHERSHRIVNGNQGGTRLKMLETDGDGILTTLSSSDHLHWLFETRTRNEGSHLFDRFLWRRNNDVVDKWCGIELRDGMDKDRRAIQNKKLLWTFRPHAASRASSCDDCANFHSLETEARS